MNKEKIGIPKLRFPGFTGAWEQRKVSDIFTVTRGQVLATTKISEVKTNEMCFPVYSSQTKNNGLMGYYNKYLFNTAITWTTDGANAGTVNYREGKFYSTNVNGVLLSDDGYANRAIAEILDRVAWRHVSRVGNPKLMNNVMSNIKISIPSSFEEQNAISEFLTKFDHLIALHQRKLEHLKQQKNGLLQKMFPKSGESVPEVRFPGFTDSWEQRKLGEVATFSKGTGYSKQDLESDGTPIILYGRMYTNYELVIHSVNTFTTAKEKSIYSNGGEVIVPASGETAEDISVASVVEQANVILGGDLNIIHTNKNVEPVFLALSITNGEPHKDMAKRAQGKSVVHLHNSDLAQIKLSYPSKDEQKKIDSYFLKFDSLIALYQRKLEHLELLKKGLLQQMFV